VYLCCNNHYTIHIHVLTIQYFINVEGTCTHTYTLQHNHCFIYVYSHTRFKPLFPKWGGGCMKGIGGPHVQYVYCASDCI